MFAVTHNVRNMAAYIVYEKGKSDVEAAIRRLPVTAGTSNGIAIKEGRCVFYILVRPMWYGHSKEKMKVPAATLDSFGRKWL